MFEVSQILEFLQYETFQTVFVQVYQGKWSWSGEEAHYFDTSSGSVLFVN